MDMYHFFLLIIGVVVIVATAVEEKNCQISIDLSKGDVSEPQPLILADIEKPRFLLPNEKSLLIIPRNTSILLACSGANNSFDNFEPTQVLKAVCVNEKQFLVSSKVYSFNSFKCKRLPEDAVKKSNDSCFGNHQKYEIGFEIQSYFLKLSEVCRDAVNYRTYYSKHIIVKEIDSYQTKYKRPQWKNGPFYSDVDVNKLYTFKSELDQVENQLGSRELAEKYIYFDKDNLSNQWQSFHRGHLTPKADFVYGAQQSATFWLLNANPQWGSFNSGNWMYLESSVRKLAITRRMNLVVYTGVHEIATLKDINDNEQPLYLYANSTEKLLPVPRYFWKIIYDPISNRATAFVGDNKAYADKITDDVYLCSDITNKYEFLWLTWQPNNVTLGVSYACTVESLRKIVPSIPEIGQMGVLV